MSEFFDKDQTTECQETAPQEAEKQENQLPVIEKQENSTIFVKHVYETKKPAAKSGGRRRIFTCIIAVALCVCIAASILLVSHFIPKEDDSTSSATGLEDTSIHIVDASKLIKPSFVEVDGKSVEVESNIKWVKLYNYYEHYQFNPSYVPAQKDTSTSSSSSSSSSKKKYDYDINWSIGGIDESLTDSDSIDYHIDLCLDLYAMRSIENTFDTVEQYHKAYGLDDPTRVLEVAFNDGTENLTITIGTWLPTKDSNYVTVSGDDTVYVVKSIYVSNYDYLPTNFANKTAVKKLAKTDKNAKYFNSNDQLAKFDYIKLSGSIYGGETIEFRMSDDHSAEVMPFVMTKPYSRPANESYVEEILGLVGNGLNATTVYSYGSTEETRKACGFDAPQCVIEIGVGDDKCKIFVGGKLSEEETDLAVMVEGRPQIFCISMDTFTFASAISGDITVAFNNKFILESITSLKTFKISTAGKTHEVSLSHVKREDSENSYDTAVKYGNAVMETQSFKNLYHRILSLSLIDFVTEAEKTETVLSMTFVFNDGAASKTVELTEIPDDMYHYTAWVNGVPLGEVLKTTVDDVIQNLDVFVSGGQVPSVW